MATTVDELLLKISADTQAFQKSMDEVNRRLAETSQATASTADNTSNLAVKTAGLHAVFQVVVDVAKKVASALYEVGKASWENVDALQELSDQTGVAVDKLQRFQYAAELTGSNSAAAAQLLRSMQLEIGQAGQDGSEAAKKFNDLGLSVAQLKSVGATEAAAILADKVASVKDASEQAELAMQLFGRGARENLGFIKEGGENMRQLAAEAEGLGIGLNAIDVKYLAGVNDRITGMKLAFEQVGNQLAIAFAPFIQGVVVKLMGDALGKTQDIAGSFNTLADSVAATLDYVNSVFQAIRTLVNGIGTILAGFVTAIVAPFDAVYTGFQNLVALALKAVASLSDALGMVETSNWASAKATEMSAYQYGLTKDNAAVTAQFARDTAEAFKDWAGSGYTFRNSVAQAKADLDYMRNNPTKTSGGPSNAGGTGFTDADVEAQATRERIATAQGEWARYYARRVEMEKEFQEYYAETKADPTEAEKAHIEALQMNWEAYYAKRKEMENLFADEYKQQKTMTEAEAIQASQMFFSNMASLTETGNKKLFEIGKVAAIAETTVSTYKAAQEAFTWGTKTGGPVLGYALAASAVVAGMARVAKISSTKMGGGGGGGDTGGGAGMGGSSGINSGSTGAPAPRQTNVNVTLHGSSFGQDQVRGLVAAIGEAVGDNVKLGVA